MRQRDSDRRHLRGSGEAVTLTYLVGVTGAGLSYAKVVSDLAAQGVTIGSVDEPVGDYWRFTASPATDADVTTESVLERYFGDRLLLCVDQAIVAHRGGTVSVVPSVPVDTASDVALLYGAGARRVARRIAADGAAADELTGRANSVAIVSDGSWIRGLGGVGPEAALAVMEGKAVLFDALAGINAVPLCVNTGGVDELVSAVAAVAPSFGGVNLDGIWGPKSVEAEARLRELLAVPVFHDDQHGTAIVACAALWGALEITGRRLADARIVVYGTDPGATALTRCLVAEGAGDVVVWASVGPLRPEVGHLVEPHERWLAHHTNPRRLSGSLEEVLQDADVLIVSSLSERWPGTVTALMAPLPVVLALPGARLVARGPIPEDWSVVAATGQDGDVNSISSVLAFPGVFRGLLDAKASSVTPTVVLAAARALADVARPNLSPTQLLPDVMDPRVVPAVVDAVRRCAGAT